MKILFVSPEALPYSKSGGLGDAARSLPEVLSGSVDITLATPLYRTPGTGTGSHTPHTGFTVAMGDDRISCTVYKAGEKKNFRALLFSQDLFFAREFIYGSNEREYHDNFFRYLFFQKAVIRFIRESTVQYDIIHLNDWQTSLIPALMKEEEKAGMRAVPSVLNIHNLGYQGIFDHYHFAQAGLPGSYFTPRTMEFHGKMNCLKGGIIFSDRIVTVSPSYSREILTEEYGHGLDGVLKDYAFKLSGILNGIDHGDWDPVTDPFIFRNYSSRDFGNKSVNKRSLITEYRLPFSAEDPLAVSVTRLAEQKGIELIIKSMKDLRKRKINFILLGTGDRRFEDELEELDRKNPRFTFFKRFDEKLSHRLYAAGDIFMMPSLYEPCGLSQLYALRYGAIPVVTETGGLKDTVEEISPGRGTGFVFSEKSADALTDALLKASGFFRQTSDWESAAVRGMQKDFSWKRSGKDYLELYKNVLKEK